jgi:transposase
VLEAIDKEFLSFRSACVRLNIPSKPVIISCQKSYKLIGQSGLIPQSKEHPQIMTPPIKRKSRKLFKTLTKEEKLLLENEYLKAENKLLQKASSLS